MVTRVESDVLVIGAGGAGLRAAIEAKSLGASVSVVSKAPAGMNNATVLSVGLFRAAIKGLAGDESIGFSPEEHFNDTIVAGKGLNDSPLVDVISREGGKRVFELRDFGVSIRVDGSLVFAGTQPISRGILRARGLGLIRPLVDHARSHGVEFFENIIVSKLVLNNGSIAGAVGYDFRKDVPIMFSSKTVILATGGAGALYTRTDNPPRNIGDGYSLAYRIGAKLRDMEFVQFFPLALSEPGKPALLIGGDISEEGRIINKLGEDITHKHGITARPLVLKSRDLLSRAIMIEVLEGRGIEGSVLIEATELFKRMREDESFSFDYKFFQDQLGATERPFRVAPISHFCMGGVIVEINGFTGVPGLFAAGEVVGGVHGANRLGGNALTDIIVFGARAGFAAAEYAKTCNFKSVDLEAHNELERYKKLRGDDAEEKDLPRSIMSRLREIMWMKAGVIRGETGLNEAINDIEKLKRVIPKLQATSGRMMLQALEVPMALDTAEMICRSALKRTESRGSHYRKDYPREDEGWRKIVVISNNSGDAMQLSTNYVN